MDHIDELFRRVTGHVTRIATATSGLDEASRNNIELPEYTSAVALLLKGAEKGSCSVVTRPPIPTPRPLPTPTPTPSPTPTPLPTPTPTPTPIPTEIPTSQEEGESTDSTPATNESGRTGGWFGNLLKKVTDGINDTFNKAEDEEI